MKPRPYPRADKIEPKVIRQLFDLLGNPAMVERAIKRAMPDRDKLLKREPRREEELAKTERSKLFALKQHEEGKLTAAEAEKRLAELAARQTVLLAEREKDASALAEVVPVEQLKFRIVENNGRKEVVYHNEHGFRLLSSSNELGRLVMDMSKSGHDKRDLIKQTFSSLRPDGKPWIVASGVRFDWSCKKPTT
jgi:hypothetical protein